MELTGTIERLLQAELYTIELLCKQEVLWPEYCYEFLSHSRGNPIELISALFIENGGYIKDGKHDEKEKSN